MCIKRTIRVGCIQEPATALLVSNNIDDTANSIGTEPHRHYPFINLNPVGKIHRNIIQSERVSHSFLWYTVNEYLNVLPAESVQHELHIRTYAARFTKFHTRCFGQSIAQILRRILQFFRINSHCIEG